jgi:hypothetical protein
MSAVAKMPRKPSAYAKYWAIYGGWRAIGKSGYFHTAVVVTAVCYELWKEPNWWDVSIAILPSMMGFSIAAFALIIAVGHERFLEVLATRPPYWDSSALEGTAAAFFHFLLVQALALVAALVGKGADAFFEVLRKGFVQYITAAQVIHYASTIVHLVIGATGFLLLVYAITCALAASARIFSLSLRFGDLLQLERKRREAAAADQSESEPVHHNIG